MIPGIREGGGGSARVQVIHRVQQETHKPPTDLQHQAPQPHPNSGRVHGVLPPTLPGH